MIASTRPLTIVVAIPTRNRCALLAQTLERLTTVTIPPMVDWEVLIVANDCSDQTVTVARQYADRLPLRVIEESEPGASVARNRALRESSSDYIIFTDDDVLADQGWIESFVAAARRFPEAAAFGGRIDPWFPTQPEEDILAAFPTLRIGFCAIDHPQDEGPLPRGAHIYSANIAFRRAALGDLRFDATLGPAPTRVGGCFEEVAFVNALYQRGATVIWVPTMRVAHYVDPSRMTVPYLLELYKVRARLETRMRGGPMGTQAFGVPRWLVRAWLESKVRSLYATVIGQRRRALDFARTCAELEGMMLECRQIHREAHS